MKWKMIFCAVLGLAMVLAIFTSLSPISAAVVGNGTVVSVNGSSTIQNGIAGLNSTGNGTVYLNENSYNGSGNGNITIITNRNITIIGNGTDGTVINGTSSYWLFNVSKGSYLTLINLTIANCYKNANGGAIYSQTSLILINCNLTNNMVNNGGEGGAIWFNTSLSVVNCSFVNNSVTAWNSYGGAIFAVYSSSKATIVDCSFVNNSANDGGAIRGLYNSIVVNCSFVNNVAGYGGAINMAINSLIVDCSFVNNSARFNGGAIDSLTGGSSVKYAVVNCSFVNNSARSGGAINSLIGHGAGNGTVVNCSFVNNSARFNGGAIHAMGVFSFVNCSFVNNIANNSGGAICVTASDIFNDITNCSFVNNSALGTDYLSIGYWNGSLIESGKIYLSGGGAIALVVMDGWYANLLVIDCSFVNNSAVSGGGAIFNEAVWNRHYINVSGSLFKDNYAREGGAIYHASLESLVSKSLNVFNSSFVNNSANNSGGAIYDISNSSINISESIFDYNVAGVSGGAICNNGTRKIDNYYINNPVWVIDGSVFTNNVAGVSGGAICSLVNASYNRVINSSFTNNGAGSKGGDVYNNITMNLTSNKFTGAKAGYGGAVFNQGNMSLVNNAVKGSSATIMGHQIYNNGSMGVLRLTFINNETWYPRAVIALFATLTDDNGNNVTGQNISLLLGNGRGLADLESREGRIAVNFNATNNLLLGSNVVYGAYAGHGAYNIVVRNGSLLGFVNVSSNLSFDKPRPVVNETITGYLNVTNTGNLNAS
ncbi:MAG: hypothetical protein ACRC1M_07145, partial [Methanobacteriaceae archaeon]